MLDELLSLDKRLLIFLNGLGSKTYDPFFLFFTNPVYWTPFFIFLFYLIYKKAGIKTTLIVILFVALLVFVTDHVVNLFKHEFQRLRPVNDPTVNKIIRIVITSPSFSFFSGHAAISMAASIFIYRLLKPYYRGMAILFLWPLVFAYSRIYLGLHFPGDVLCGYLCGILTGNLIFMLYDFTRNKYPF